MEQLWHIVEQIWDLLNEMSPYLLLGFLLAGLMHVFVPGSLYSRFLAKGNFRSVLYAALFGIPLPLCSCGVIPTAMSLRREGASKGAAVSFLIATPQTGVDSIIATFSLMGLPFAIVRPIAALLTAIFGGHMVNVANRKEEQTIAGVEAKVEEGETCGESHCHCHEESETCGEAHCHCHEESETCGESHCHCHENPEGEGFFCKLKAALQYAFVEMMEDIGKWLVVGLVVAGLITILVPDSFFSIFQGNTFLSMLLVLCIAVPMYICATGSIPIAVALMMKGLTPGSALVLLMAGPACNVASILVINKVLGRRTLVTYLASIITGSILFGVIIDQFLPAEWFLPTASLVTSDCCHEHAASWWSIASTVLLICLLLHALWNRFCGHSACTCHCHEEEGKESCHCHDEECHCHDEECHCKDGECHCHECDDDDDDDDCCHCGEDARSEATPRIAFTIKGMNCNHCRANAEKVLLSLPGVSEVTVDLASGRAEVVGHTTIDEARQALASLGFDVV